MLERHNKYKHFHWYVTINESGFRSGFVGIYEDHNLYEKDINYFDFIVCHNGISFVGHKNEELTSADWLIGFSCNNSSTDGLDVASIKRYYGQQTAENIIKSRLFRDTLENFIWTAENVEDECKHIIDQIISRDKTLDRIKIDKINNIYDDFISGKYK